MRYLALRATAATPEMSRAIRLIVSFVRTLKTVKMHCTVNFVFIATGATRFTIACEQRPFVQTLPNGFDFEEKVSLREITRSTV